VKLKNGCDASGKQGGDHEQGQAQDYNEKHQQTAQCEFDAHQVGVSVLSIARRLSNQAGLSVDPAGKGLSSRARKACVKRNALAHKQRVLTEERLEAVLETCENLLKEKRDRALLLFAWALGRRRNSEVSKAVLEKLHRGEEGGYLYTLASPKTNNNGTIRPGDVKPVVGRPLRGPGNWLKVSDISSAPLFAGSRACLVGAFSRTRSSAPTGFRGRRTEAWGDRIFGAD